MDDVKPTAVSLTAEEGARAERISLAFAQAEVVLGTAREAREFMLRPHLELGGRAPIDVAASPSEAHRVERILASLAYGLPV